VGELQLPGLFHHCGGDFRHAVPDQIYRRGARKVEVPLAFGVPQINALTADCRREGLAERAPENRRGSGVLCRGGVRHSVDYLAPSGPCQNGYRMCVRPGLPPWSSRAKARPRAGRDASSFRPSGLPRFSTSGPTACAEGSILRRPLTSLRAGFRGCFAINAPAPSLRGA